MPTAPISIEHTTLRLFLKQQCISQPRITPLPRDASKRYYYRVEGEGLLIMVADATQKPEQFKRMSNILLSIGLNAPSIHAEQGDFYLIDDLGNNTYRAAMTDTNRAELYEKATDVLIHIAKHLKTQPEGIPAYTSDVILTELMLFLEWYDASFSPANINEFTNIWQHYLSQMSGPQTLILRDYHIDNLFYIPERDGLQQVGLIDFQDGVFGPAPVDLISLTEDARVDVSGTIRAHVTQRFMNAFPAVQHEALIRTAKIVDLARQLRILGVFFRLAKRDGRTPYLNYVPRLHMYVKQHLKDPFFKDFARWCRTHDLFQD